MFFCYILASFQQEYGIFSFFFFGLLLSLLLKNFIWVILRKYLRNRLVKKFLVYLVKSLNFIIHEERCGNNMISLNLALQPCSGCSLTLLIKCMCEKKSRSCSQGELYQCISPRDLYLLPHPPNVFKNFKLLRLFSQ